MRDGMKLYGVAALVLVAGFVAILLFNALWFRIGFGAAIAVIVGILLFVAWRFDKREEAARAEYDGI